MKTAKYKTLSTQSIGNDIDIIQCSECGWLMYNDTIGYTKDCIFNCEYCEHPEDCKINLTTVSFCAHCGAKFEWGESE